MQSVLLVEAHTDTQNWLTEQILTALGPVDIQVSATLDEAGRQLAVRRPMLAVVDLCLPDGNGCELVRQMARECPETQCVVYTALDDDEHLFGALRAGVSGYLLHNQSDTKVVQALRGLNEGTPPLSPVVARRILRYFHEAPVAHEPGTNVLSARECEVLTLLAKGLERQDVARLLGVSINTAASHIKAIYHKLNVSGRAEATLEAVRLGLVRTGSATSAGRWSAQGTETDSGQKRP